jgi:glycosyltransferase involved in cell wall biosynthesis
VNGSWPAQPGHVHSFLNPSLTTEEVAAAGSMAEGKRLVEPVRLVFVGRLERPKGVERCLEILQAAKEMGIRAELDLVGDGPERDEFVSIAARRGIADAVRFHGWLPRPALESIYGAAHFMVFPATSSEGWPKALSEAMAYGAVPLAGAISSIPQYLSEFQAGRAHPPLCVSEFASSIAWYMARPAEWARESARGVALAERFTYSSYLKRVRDLLKVTREPGQRAAWDAPAPLRI